MQWRLWAMMHEQPLRACRREFVGQAGAAHTELPQGRKAGAQAGYWRPPRQRRDQVAPHAQPGALPTAELLQGWCEARVAHRWHTVLGTTLSSRPHRPGLCRHLLPQPRAATAPLAPGPGRALPGEAGHGLPVPEHTPGQRPWQAQPADWAVRGAGLHHSRAMALPGLPWGDGPRLAQQGTHRVLPHAWRACFWGRRVRSPPCPRVSPHTPQALGDAQHGTGHCPRGIAAPSSASPETTGWRPSAAAPSLPVPLPEPGGNLLKHAHPGVPHSSGCVWRDQMTAACYGLLLPPKAVLGHPSLRWIRCSLIAPLTALAEKTAGLLSLSCQVDGLNQLKTKPFVSKPGRSWRRKWPIWLILWKRISNCNGCRRKGTRDTNWEGKTTPCILYLCQRQTIRYLRTSQESSVYL